MAGDWIPMRTDLAGDPRVLAIARWLCGTNLFGEELRFNVIVTLGALHQFWSWAQAQTVDGTIEGVDLEAIGSIVGVPGFGEALKKVRWIKCIKADAFTIPEFDKWMGNGSKKRLLNARRQDSWRKRQRDRNAGVTDVALPKGQESKRTGEKKKSKSAQIEAFDAWWERYPRKVGKGLARRSYEKATGKISREKLLDAVTLYAAAVSTWPADDKEYIPYPATWLNQERWSDDPATWQRKERDVGRKFRA